ncbi:ABC transporter ATP-binding protein [Virgibacillus flavescens]|uniref:ABC transporter ATP-binding protein n=1 Tax=Virgibacillus flavescens TaxID=1611422 RepID=UPI003D337BB8
MTLIINNVTKRFGENTAVNHLSLEIPEKEMFGFLGGNGAGKTTTFRMILGLMNVSGGEITWNGESISYEKSHLIGYLPEERGLYPKLKVRDQIVYLGKLRGMKKSEIIVELEAWLKRFKVPEYIDKKVEELSKGNQQKIQFISAVIHKPKLLILDEPFSGLDPINVEMLKEAVVDLKEKGTSIIFSSHQMDHVEELCEHLCILQKGKQIVHGSLRDIKKSYGKKNLIIHGDTDFQFLRNFEGVVKYRPLTGGCELQIENEAVSQSIFASLQGHGFIRKFDLEEPTLNDIFIEKVGASYE